ncbi:MAG: hypothetical protein AMXMBFR33_11260 [Candidatus Xenobia bacterium]
MTIEKSPEMLAIARRVVWFATPEEALEQPALFLAHVMTYGLVEDVLIVQQAVGMDAFRSVLDAPPPGVFDPRSWSYWNLMCDRWPAPPLPERQFPD